MASRESIIRDEPSLTIPGSGNKAELVFWRGMLVLALVVVLVTAIGVLRQPLIEDEVEFAEVARSYAVSGQPLAHVHGELQVVVSHPQLYHILLSLFSMAGGAEWGGRCFGLLCLLASAWLGSRLALRLWHFPNIGSAIAVMILLCPLCLRGSLLLNIDSTLLPVLCLGFLLAATNIKDRPSTFQLLGLTGIFTIALWCKLTTPLLLTIPLWIFWGRHRKREFFIIILGGLLLFIVTWALFCWWRELDLLDPIWLLLRKAKSSMGLTAANWHIELGKRLLQYVLWMSPFLFGVLLLPKVLIPNRRWLHGLVMFVAAGLLLYWVKGGSIYGFPGYQIPVVMVGMVLLAPLITKGWEIVGGRHYTLILLVIIGSVFLAMVSGDALYPFYTYPEKAALGNLRTWRLAFQLAGVVGGVLCYGAIFFLLWKDRAFVWWRKIGVLSAVILFPWWIGQDVVMSRAYYNTAYLYGERGIREVGAVLERSLPDGAEIIAPKDVAYYTGYRFPHQVLGAVCEQGNLATELARKNVQALVYRDSQWIDSITGPCLASSSVQNALNSQFRYYHVGNFRVWIKQGDTPRNAGNSP